MKRLIEEFQNGDINLKVYDVDGTKKYWLRAGVALLELNEDNLMEMYTLIRSYVNERIEESLHPSNV